ncbi:MAG: endolytic transglycosylase MltG [Pseudomonadota bacterium]
MSVRRGFLFACGFVFGIAALAAIGIAVDARRWWLSPVAALGGSVQQISVGATYGGLVRRWQDAGLIQRPLYWRIAGRLSETERKMQAGEYRVTAASTPADILAQLRAGSGQLSYEVLIVEGTRVDQLRAALAAQEPLRATLTDVPDSALLAALGYPPGHPEGRFFPATYRYARGTTDRELLRQAFERMRAELDAAWSARATSAPLRSPDEALILASIIEKETGTAADRPLISQVFHRRLQLGMKLQTDPTVIYGVGAAFDGDLTRRHLRTDTPYNTYTRHGLPPTPIALPGRESLRAAVSPASGDFLYFVARGDGSSQFSRTLDEHNAAVRRYQLRR